MPPLEVEFHPGHGAQLHAAVAAQQGVIHPHHQVGQGHVLLVELGTGKTRQLHLQLRAWQSVTTELGGQHGIRHLQQLPVLIKPCLESTLQGAGQGRLVRRPLRPLQTQGQAAPLPERQPIGLEGEGVEPLGRITQTAAEVEILELALDGLPGQFELGLTLEIKGQIPWAPLAARVTGTH